MDINNNILTNEELSFTAFEYTSTRQLIKANYSIIMTDMKIIIKRKYSSSNIDDDARTNMTIDNKNISNTENYLTLNKDGYKVLKTLYCGICSTDLSREYLPFPLPQVLGHEILACDIKDCNTRYVVEISDNCINNCSKKKESYCLNGLKQHCPGRFVIGINTLLGGFSPYIVVPIKSAILINPENINNNHSKRIQDLSATMIEPFAAALNAITSSLPSLYRNDKILNKNDIKYKIAVLGPKKLGAFILLGLKYYRIKHNMKYSITAIIKREDLKDYCLEMGADELLLAKDIKNKESYYDIVYDCTGNSEGFSDAVYLAKSELHLKSTSGQVLMGFKNFTALVVDEISIGKFDYNEFLYRVNHIIKCYKDKLRLEIESNKYVTEINKDVIEISVLLSSSIEDLYNNNNCDILSILKRIIQYINIEYNYHINDKTTGNCIINHKVLLNIKTYSSLKSNDYIFEKNDFNCFDLVLVSNKEEIDYMIRPFKSTETSLVKPKGIILYYNSGNSKNNVIEDANCNNALLQKIENGLMLTTSRCGDFHYAISLLIEFPEINDVIIKNMITKVINIDNLNEAFEYARRKDIKKIVIQHK